MSNRPPITYKPKVCVICEGLEEKIYFDRLTKIGVLNKHYRFFPQDAGGQAKIFAKFQAVYQNDNYDVILILCDTDKKPHKGYNEMRKRINEQFNSRTAVTNRIVIYTNPCTMQIVLSHFAEVELKTQSKSVNAPIIEKLTGVSGYKAKKKQIEDICKQITHELLSIRTKLYVSGRGRNSPAVLPVNQAVCLRSLRKASISSAVGTLTMPT